jgi:hypothetical protein
MSFSGLPIWTVIALLGAAAAILWALHLLRVRPRELRVVTSLFWAQAVERTRARSLLERFRHPLTYLLLLSLCGMLILTLARPQRRNGREGTHAVIILDAGANMTARAETGGLDLDLARQAVVDRAGALAGGDAVAVIVLDPLPRLVHGFTDPRPLIEGELGPVRAAGVPASLRLGCDVARSLLAGHAMPQIVLVTNRPPETTAADVTVIPVGQSAPNAAIVSALFVPDEANPLKGSLITRVVCFSEGEQRVSLQVNRAGGAPLLNETATLASGAGHDFVTAGLPADGDQVVARLAAGGGATADDEVTLRLPLRTPIRIRGGPGLPAPLRLALQADPAVRFAGAGEAYDVEARVGPAPADAAVPMLAVEAAGTVQPDMPLSVATDHPLVQGLSLPAGRSRSENGLNPVLVAAGPVPLVRMIENAPPLLVLHPGLWADSVGLHRRGEFAVLLSRCVRHLAGWEPEPLTLEPVRSLEDPAWAARVGPGLPNVMPANRVSANLAGPAAGAAGKPAEARRQWNRPEPYEWLLILGFVLFLVEAWLQLRGRIS